MLNDYIMYELKLFSLRQLKAAYQSPFCKVKSVQLTHEYLKSEEYKKNTVLYKTLNSITEHVRAIDQTQGKNNKKDKHKVRVNVQLRTFQSCKAWLENVNRHNAMRIIVLDQVQDPQNVGAIIRSAKFFNYDAVLMLKDNAAPLTSTVVQASSSAIFDIPIIRIGNLRRELEFLKKQQFFCLGLAVQAEKKLSESHFLNEDIAIIMGHEGNGLRELTEKACDELYRISDAPGFESLNVSVASAISMYKFLI